MKSQVAAFKASQSLLSLIVCFVVIRYQANVQELKPTVLEANCAGSRMCR